VGEEVEHNILEEVHSRREVVGPSSLVVVEEHTLAFALPDCRLVLHRSTLKINIISIDSWLFSYHQ